MNMKLKMTLLYWNSTKTSGKFSKQAKSPITFKPTTVTHRWWCDGSILRLICVLKEDDKRCNFYCYVKCMILIIRVGGRPCPKTSAMHYHAYSGLSDKSRRIKELVVLKVGMLMTSDLQYGLALRCYQPSPEALYSTSPIIVIDSCLKYQS